MGALKVNKQELFCQEYLLDLNATQAAIRAGYAVSTAQSASRWISRENPEKPRLRARVDELLAKRAARTGVNQDRVIRELARIAFLDPTELANINEGTILDNTTEDDRAALASVKVKSGEDFTEREIRFADKLKALELLGKHLGMYTDKVDITGPLPVIVNDLADHE